MPQFINLNFLERFPIPSLRNYVLFSSVLLFSIVIRAHRKVTNEEGWVEIKDHVSVSSLTNRTKEWVNSFVGIRVVYFALTDHVSVWVIVNSACCLVALLGNFLKWLVFGKMRTLEQQHLRDRFWNFIFYKFVFVFGVLNVQYVDEVLLWSVWFIVIGLFYILTTLAQDRFKYVSSAVSGAKSPLRRILILMGFCCLSAVLLLIFALAISMKIGLNYSGFIAADAIQLLFRSMFCLCRYGAQLYDLGQTSIWERRHSFVYYSELIFELLILITEFIHHIHMLVWSNIFLSMASLVICMQLRSLYQEIDRRLKRHRNYQRVVEHMDKNFPMASRVELAANEDTCAICWDPMESARKLPCGHYFHNWCLRGWLEQDTTCPTCRRALVVGTTNEPQELPGGAPGQEGLAQTRRRRFNHFFHFDGGRYARWLPSFSVEVSHNLGGPRIFRRSALSNSQYNSMAEQVREVFPHVSLAAILDDLHETGSPDLTVENIIEGRVVAVLQSEDGTAGDGGLALDDTGDSDESAEEELSQEDASDQEMGSEATSNSSAESSEEESHGVYPPLFTSASTSSSPPVSVESGDVSPSSAGSGSRFSKSSEERESMLSERKQQLLERSRRKYMTSERGQSYLNINQRDSQDITAERRREIVADAVQRRLNKRSIQS